MKTLIIVESPAKAKRVYAYSKPVLGGDVFCRACYGHLQDLPANRLGVDLNNGFAPQYRVSKPLLAGQLRPFIAQAERVILATDPYREGEAIAWDILKTFQNELRGKIVWRVTFNAISPDAVRDGLENHHSVDPNKVRAAVARRVMDRLTGFSFSPKIWRVLGARTRTVGIGRVQAAALQIISDNSALWTVDIDSIDMDVRNA